MRYHRFYGNKFINLETLTLFPLCCLGGWLDWNSALVKVINTCPCTSIGTHLLFLFLTSCCWSPPPAMILHLVRPLFLVLLRETLEYPKHLYFKHVPVIMDSPIRSSGCIINGGENRENMFKNYYFPSFHTWPNNSHQSMQSGARLQQWCTPESGWLFHYLMGDGNRFNDITANLM